MPQPQLLWVFHWDCADLKCRWEQEWWWMETNCPAPCQIGVGFRRWLPQTETVNYQFYCNWCFIVWKFEIKWCVHLRQKPSKIASIHDRAVLITFFRCIRSAFIHFRIGGSFLKVVNFVDWTIWTWISRGRVKCTEVVHQIVASIWTIF